VRRSRGAERNRNLVLTMAAVIARNRNEALVVPTVCVAESPSGSIGVPEHGSGNIPP
jgi:hypothetical protein